MKAGKKWIIDPNLMAKALFFGVIWFAHYPSIIISWVRFGSLVMIIIPWLLWPSWWDIIDYRDGLYNAFYREWAL